MRKIATKTESKVKQPKAKRKYVRGAVSEGDVTSLKASIDSTKETFERTMSMVNNALKALVSRVEALENVKDEFDEPRLPVLIRLDLCTKNGDKVAELYKTDFSVAVKALTIAMSNSDPQEHKYKMMNVCYKRFAKLLRDI